MARSEFLFWMEEEIWGIFMFHFLYWQWNYLIGDVYWKTNRHSTIKALEDVFLAISEVNAISQILSVLIIDFQDRYSYLWNELVLPEALVTQINTSSLQTHINVKIALQLVSAIQLFLQQCSFTKFKKWVGNHCHQDFDENQ